MGIKAFRSFESDAAKEEDGVWTPIAGDETETIEMRIRRLRSTAVQEAQKKIYAPFERAMRGKDLPDAVETQCTIKLLGAAIVAGWRTRRKTVDANGEPVETIEDFITDDAGNSLAFTPENAAAIFGDEKQGKDLRSFVLGISTDADVYSPEERADDVKN